MQQSMKQATSHLGVASEFQALSCVSAGAFAETPLQCITPCRLCCRSAPLRLFPASHGAETFRVAQVSIGFFRLTAAAFRAVVLSNTMAFVYIGITFLFNGFIIQIGDVSPGPAMRSHSGFPIPNPGFDVGIPESCTHRHHKTVGRLSEHAVPAWKLGEFNSADQCKDLLTLCRRSGQRIFTLSACQSAAQGLCWPALIQGREHSPSWAQIGWWVRWLVYLSPMYWILRGLAVNEFLSQRWGVPPPPGTPVGSLLYMIFFLFIYLVVYFLSIHSFICLFVYSFT